MRLRARVIATLLWWVPVATVFVATDAAAQTKAEIAEAKEAFERGKEHYEGERFLEAAEAFQEAYDLTQRPELLYNIGQAYRFAERFEDAERYLQRYLADAPDTPIADDVVETIIEIQQQIAARMVTVTIESEPAAAEVFLDDEEEARCVTPCTVMARPGSRTFRLRAEGRREAVEVVELTTGEPAAVSIVLEPLVVRGALRVVTDRPGTLHVGDLTAEMPLTEPMELPPGTHSVRVTAGRASWEGEVTVAERQVRELYVPMEALARARKRGGVVRAMSYGLLGASAASAIASFLLATQLRNTYAALEDQEARDGFVSAGLVERGRALQVGTNAMLGTMAVTLVGGVVLFVLDELRD